MKQSKRKSTGGKVLVIQHDKRPSHQPDTLVVKQEDDGLGSNDDENDTLVVKQEDDGPRHAKKPRASELEQLSKSKNKLRFPPGFGSDSFRFRVYI